MTSVRALTAILPLALLTTTGLVQAQAIGTEESVDGSYVGIEQSWVDPGGVFDVTTRLVGEGIWDIGNSFAIQAGASYVYNSAATAALYSVHGIYSFGTTDAGVFYTHDERSVGADIQTYGLELQSRFDGFRVEGFYGQVESGALSGDFGGILGTYAINDSLDITVSYAMADGTAINDSRTAIELDYEVSQIYTTTFAAGQVEVGGVTSDFVGLGLKMRLGGRNDVMFGNRNLTALKSGF